MDIYIYVRVIYILFIYMRWSGYPGGLTLYKWWFIAVMYVTRESDRRKVIVQHQHLLDTYDLFCSVWCISQNVWWLEKLACHRFFHKESRARKNIFYIHYNVVYILVHLIRARVLLILCCRVQISRHLVCLSVFIVVVGKHKENEGDKCYLT